MISWESESEFLISVKAHGQIQRWHTPTKLEFVPIDSSKLRFCFDLGVSTSVATTPEQWWWTSSIIHHPPSTIHHPSSIMIAYHVILIAMMFESFKFTSINVVRNTLDLNRDPYLSLVVFIKLQSTSLIKYVSIWKNRIAHQITYTVVYMANVR